MIGEDVRLLEERHPGDEMAPYERLMATRCAGPHALRERSWCRGRVAHRGPDPEARRAAARIRSRQLGTGEAERMARPSAAGSSQACPTARTRSGFTTCSRVAANGAVPPSAGPSVVTSACRVEDGWGCSRTGPANEAMKPRLVVSCAFGRSPDPAHGGSRGSLPSERQVPVTRVEARASRVTEIHRPAQ